MGEKSAFNGFVYFLAGNCLRRFCAEGEKKCAGFGKQVGSFPSHLASKLWAKTAILRTKSLIINEKVGSGGKNKKISGKQQHFSARFISFPSSAVLCIFINYPQYGQRKCRFPFATRDGLAGRDRGRKQSAHERGAHTRAGHAGGGVHSAGQCLLHHPCWRGRS